MNKYGNELKEVYTILNTLVEEDYNKIPKSMIQLIESNMNKDYDYALNEEIALEENPMLDGTRALLFNIFRDYLATEEQRNKIKRMQAEDRIKADMKKQKIFNTNVFKMNNNHSNEKKDVADKQLVVYKQNFFSKIANVIKKLFGH